MGIACILLLTAGGHALAKIVPGQLQPTACNKYMVMHTWLQIASTDVTHSNAHKLANVLSCHASERCDRVLMLSCLTASCCCWHCWCIKVLVWVGDALLCVNVHIIAAQQGWGQLVDVLLVNRSRLHSKQGTWLALNVTNRFLRTETDRRVLISHQRVLI